MKYNIHRYKKSKTALKESIHIDVFYENRPDKKYVEHAVKGLANTMPNHKIMDYYLAKPASFIDSDLIVFAYDQCGGECCGFLSCNVIEISGKKCLMLYTFLVSEDKHGSRLTFLILQKLFLALSENVGLHYEYIILKTANPRSFKIIQSFSDINGAVFFPQVKDVNCGKLQSFSEVIAHYLHPDLQYNHNNGVIYNACGKVPGDFYAEVPKCRNKIINEYFSEYLTLQDRVLCILHLEEILSRVELYARFKINHRLENT